MLCLFRSFIFIFRPYIFISVFHRIVSLNLIIRYMLSTSEKRLKSQDLLTVCKFLYNQVTLQCIRSGCSVHMAGGVNICLYVCVLMYWSLVLRVCLSMCVISNQCTSKKRHAFPTFSKFDALLLKTQQGATGTKVPRLHKCWFIISLSRTIHEMWPDHTHLAKEPRQQKE